MDDHCAQEVLQADCRVDSARADLLRDGCSPVDSLPDDGSAPVDWRGLVDCVAHSDFHFRREEPPAGSLEADRCALPSGSRVVPEVLASLADVSAPNCQGACAATLDEQWVVLGVQRALAVVLQRELVQAEALPWQ
jgi:hypothetical protein